MTLPVDAAWSAAAQAAQDTAAVARSIAFVVVALPVFGGLALFTKRHLDSDPAEARSLGWAAYLTVALIGPLLAVMPLDRDRHERSTVSVVDMVT